MAIVSRVSTLTFDGGALGSRTWVATAVVQDTAAGSSVDITTTQTTTGATPPGEATTLALNLYNDDGGLVKTFNLVVGSASQTSTFFFTANGDSGGGNRCGTIAIDIRATKTTGGPANTYDYETDGSPATPPTGFTASQVDRGWIRGTTTGTMTLSNASFGGAEPNPFANGDDVFERLVLGATPFVSDSITLRFATATLSQAIASATTTFQNQFVNVVDNRFPAANSALTTNTIVGNATLATGQPWTVVSYTDETANVDPRLTADHLFQINVDTFSTPPLSGDVTDNLRATHESGFLDTRLTNARGEGRNGITFSETLTPVNPGTSVSRSGIVTATQGGQVGWGSTFMAWISSLPGGIWNKATTITAPAGNTGATYLLSGTDVYTLVARNPSVQATFSINHTDAANVGRHAKAGDTIKIVATLVDNDSRLRLVPESVFYYASRYNEVTGKLEFLDDDTDNTSAAWIEWPEATAITELALAVDLGISSDGTVFSKTLSATAGWSRSPVHFRVYVIFEGIKYLATQTHEFPSDANAHNSFAVDPIGLALAGKLTTR